MRTNQRSAEAGTDQSEGSRGRVSQRGAGQYITQLDTEGEAGLADILWCVRLKITAPLPKGKTFSSKILTLLTNYLEDLSATERRL